MNVLEYIELEMAGVRRSVDRVMNDMTPELFNWAPPGTANTISSIFVHFIKAEDDFIQKFIQGKPSIWETSSWSQKTGIQTLPGLGEGWSEFKHRQIDIQTLQDYKVAVWAATDAYLASLTPEALDRMVKFAGGERSVGAMLYLSASHSLSHNGEIAALKGIQGAKGLPI